MSKKIIRGIEAINLLRAGIETPDGKIIRLLPLEGLKIDQKYQREEVTSTVKKFIGENYDPTAIGTLQVGERSPGNYYVTDGQCRRAGLLKRKSENLPNTPDEVLCLISENSNRRKEAKQFVLHNGAKPVSGVSQFKAKVCCKEEPEWTIYNWVKDAGFDPDFTTKGRPYPSTTPSNVIRGVAILKRAYDECPGMIPLALKFLIALHGKDATASSVPFELRHGPVVYGICIFLDQYGGNDVVALGAAYKEKKHDVIGMWKKFKNSSSSKVMQHNQSELFGEWLLKCLREIGKKPMGRAA
jgi:hypothetical protein